MMNEKQYEIWDKLSWLPGETVLRLFTEYYGMKLLDEGFYRFLKDQKVVDVTGGADHAKK